MALEDLEGVGKPDVTGGRPKKSEQEEEPPRAVEADPFTRGHGEEFWLEQWQKFYSGEEDIKKTVMNVAEETMCLTRTVVKNIHDEGIHDLTNYDNEEWEQWINESDPTETSELETSRDLGTGSGLDALLR